MSINEITKNHIEYRHWQNEEDYQLFDSLGALNGQKLSCQQSHHRQSSQNMVVSTRAF